MLNRLRHVVFGAVLLHGAFAVSWVGHADACTDVWASTPVRRACCALSAHTRWTQPGGDCCDYGSVEDRSDGGCASPVTVRPPGLALESYAPALAARPAARWLRGDPSVAERPPDRPRATTVLLI